MLRILPLRLAACLSAAATLDYLLPSKHKLSSRFLPSQSFSLCASSASVQQQAPPLSSTQQSQTSPSTKRKLGKAIKKPLERSEIYSEFKQNTEATAYIFHSHQRPFHLDFVNRVFKLFQSQNIRVYTIDEYTENDFEHFKGLVPRAHDLAYEMQYPIVLFKKGDHVLSLDPQKLDQERLAADYFRDQYRRAFTAQTFNSVAEFVSILQKYNRKLSDSIAVIYSEKSAEKIRQKCPVAWGVMAEQNRAIVITHDTAVAQKLKLDPDAYYVYSKPSYLNGFQDLYARRGEINLEYLQAAEGMCRDKFVPNEEFLKSKEMKKMLKRSPRGLVTTPLVKTLADSDDLFDRTYDTEFLFEPEWDPKKIKSTMDRPVVMLYMPEMMSEVLVPRLKKVLAKFSGQFTFYFTDNESEARKVFPTDDLLGLPYISILDNTRKVLVKGRDHIILSKLPEASSIFYDVEYHSKSGKPVTKKPPKQLNQEEKKEYERKMQSKINRIVLEDPSLCYPVTYYEQIFKLEQIGEQVERFLKSYWAGELSHDYVSPSYKQKAFVTEVNASSLSHELRKNVEAGQCIVEAFAPHCGSCQYNGKVLNAFSRKLRKHNLHQHLPLFRMNSKNISPVFGRFPYTPMYLYVKFEKDESAKNPDGVKITRVERVPPMFKFSEFKEKLIQMGAMPEEFAQKIFIDPQEQFQAFYFQKDLEENFEIDFDLEKARAKEQEAAEQKKLKQEEKNKLVSDIQTNQENGKEEPRQIEAQQKSKIDGEVEDRVDSGSEVEKAQGEAREGKSGD